ncbi:M3 family metallopeptidase, partial [Rhizobium leguminosarum]|uniref:M3 family metallopeptidase n=1 Tax=Rhizobium leguminosarum TaxID=384 RepID=UPI003F9614FF
PRATHALKACSRGENAGETDNRAVIKATLELRHQVATLLGYGNFAELKLDNKMAKTADAVNALLRAVWARAVKRAG